MADSGKPNYKIYKVHCFLGSVPERAAEYWTQSDWENHSKYVEALKNLGEYGKKVEVTISIKQNPWLNTSVINNNPFPLESYSMFFIDLNSKI